MDKKDWKWLVALITGVGFTAICVHFNALAALEDDITDMRLDYTERLVRIETRLTATGILLNATTVAVLIRENEGAAPIGPQPVTE